MASSDSSVNEKLCLAKSDQLVSMLPFSICFRRQGMLIEERG